ncbi:Protein of unknown function [Flavobacteriaceae bacterium MAR_2010_188]|nr:Protein of unknown function [Flavobacteriaceae bacterium MAR_2010_188]
MRKERKNDSSQMGDLLKDFIKTNKLEKGLTKIDVKDAWENTMGSGVNNYTNKVYFENDTLHVSLSSSVLREELSYGKQKIIDMLNEYIGNNVIKKIMLH